MGSAFPWDNGTPHRIFNLRGLTLNFLTVPKPNPNPSTCVLTDRSLLQVLAQRQARLHLGRLHHELDAVRVDQQRPLRHRALAAGQPVLAQEPPGERPRSAGPPRPRASQSHRQPLLREDVKLLCCVVQIPGPFVQTEMNSSPRARPGWAWLAGILTGRHPSEKWYIESISNRRRTSIFPRFCGQNRGDSTSIVFIDRKSTCDFSLAPPPTSNTEKSK